MSRGLEGDPWMVVVAHLTAKGDRARINAIGRIRSAVPGITPQNLRERATVDALVDGGLQETTAQSYISRVRVACTEAGLSADEVGGKKPCSNTVEFGVTKPASDALRRLHSTGLYGVTPQETARAIFMHGLRALLPSSTEHDAGET